MDRPTSPGDASTVAQDPIKPDPDDDSASDAGEPSEDDTSTGYKPKHSLTQATVTTRSMQDLMGLLDTNQILLNPEYQRDVVWDPTRMRGLIDSVMENYYIPPVVFNLKPANDRFGRPSIRVCVDGKQRISSVRAFMRGEVGCNDKYNNKWYYTNRVDEHGNIIKPSRRRILPDHIKQQFASKTFICYEYENLRGSEEEELFTRVQMGIALNASEKIRATSGPWQEFAKLYEEDFAEVVGLVRIRRSTGFLFLLDCFSQIIEVQNPTRGDGKPAFKSSTASVTKLTENTSLLTPELKSHLGRVFRIFKSLVEMDPQLFKTKDYKTFAPIEFVGCAVLISMYGNKCTKNVLLGYIRAMRQALRQKLIDLRLNAANWVVLWEFLETLETSNGTKVDERMSIKSPQEVRPTSPLQTSEDIRGSSVHERTSISSPQSLQTLDPADKTQDLELETANDPVPTRNPQKERHINPSLTNQAGSETREQSSGPTAPSRDATPKPKKRLARFSASTGTPSSAQLPAFSKRQPLAGSTPAKAQSPSLPRSNEDAFAASPLRQSMGIPAPSNSQSLPTRNTLPEARSFIVSLGSSDEDDEESLVPSRATQNELRLNESALPQPPTDRTAPTAPTAPMTPMTPTALQQTRPRPPDASRNATPTTETGKEKRSRLLASFRARAEAEKKNSPSLLSLRKPKLETSETENAKPRLKRRATESKSDDSAKTLPPHLRNPLGK